MKDAAGVKVRGKVHHSFFLSVGPLKFTKFPFESSIGDVGVISSQGPRGLALHVPRPCMLHEPIYFSRKEWFPNKSFYENPDKPALLRANFAYLITVHVKILKFQHEYCMVRVSIINLGG